MFSRLKVHRARSASRSKRFAGTVGGSRKFLGAVDESATGSVSFLSGVAGARVSRSQGDVELLPGESAPISRQLAWLFGGFEFALGVQTDRRRRTGHVLLHAGGLKQKGRPSGDNSNRGYETDDDAA